MRAVVWYGSRDVRVEDRPEPRADPGEVLLRVAYCGICGSDLHEYADGPHAVPVAEPHPASGVRAPLILGHEFCGTVVAVGNGVAGLSVGDRVAVEANYRCGDCPRCRAGEYNICRHSGFAGLMGNGGLAELAAIPAYMAHRLPKGVTLRQAALFEPASVALHALRRAETVPGASLLVLGCGPVGLLTVLLARHVGAGRVIVVEPDPDRRALALRLGADEALPDCRPVRKLTGGEGADISIEAAGSGQALTDCLAVTRRGGRVVLVGLAGRISLDALAVVNNEQSIIGSVGYRNTYPELIRLVTEEGLDFTPVITSVIPLEAVIGSGFETLLRGGGGQVKILVAPCSVAADVPDAPGRPQASDHRELQPAAEDGAR